MSDPEGAEIMDMELEEKLGDLASRAEELAIDAERHEDSDNPVAAHVARQEAQRLREEFRSLALANGLDPDGDPEVEFDRPGETF